MPADPVRQSSTTYSDRRRKFERFYVEMAAEFSWSANGKEQRADGRTRDLSTHGIFIFCERCPREGTMVAVELTLPCQSGPARRMRLRGRVLRTELVSEQHKVGFAASCVKQLTTIAPAEA